MKYILGFALLFLLPATVWADDEDTAPIDVVDPIVSPEDALTDAPAESVTGDRKKAPDATVAVPAASDDPPVSEPLDLAPAVEEATPAIAVEEGPAPVKSDLQKIGPVGVSADRFDEAERPFNHRKSHWVGTYGFQNSKYVVPLQYTGSKVNFKDEDRELWGGRAGIGYELYLGLGLLLQGRLDGYYLGTVFQQDKVAKNAAGAKVGSEKDTGQMAGGDAVLHAGWMFDLVTKNPILGEMTYLAVEPFVEASYGRGQAYNRKKYYFNGAQSDAYRFTMTDYFSSQSVSVGLNVLSTNSGFFLNLKATRMFLTIDNGDRRISSTSTVNSASASSVSRPNDVRIDPVTIFTLGGGYKF